LMRPGVILKVFSIHRAMDKNTSDDRTGG